jgi:hypothetical protein
VRLRCSLSATAISVADRLPEGSGIVAVRGCEAMSIRLSARGVVSLTSSPFDVSRAPHNLRLMAVS